MFGQTYASKHLPGYSSQSNPTWTALVCFDLIIRTSDILRGRRAVKLTKTHNAIIRNHIQYMSVHHNYLKLMLAIRAVYLM